MAALEIAERRRGSVTIVELKGRFVAEEGDTSFAIHIRGLVASGQVSLLMNLARVTYIDSGGIGALVSMFLHVSRRGGRLKFVSPAERVLRVLRMTRLVDVFEIFEDEEAALRSFSTPSELPEPARRLTA